MLSKVKKEEFKAVLEAAADKNLAHCSKILLQWSISKRDLYDLFGQKLTIEQKVDTYLDDLTTSSKIVDLLSKICSIPELKQVCCKIKDGLDDPAFIDGIRKNKLIDGKNTIKMSKYLAQYVLDPDKQISMYRNDGMLKSYTIKQYFDIELSKLIQECRFTDTLVLSIDPIDYLTMSIGNSWSSCHNIYNGCHKAGCLSYLTDKHTVIAYIKGKKEENFGEETINVKNWRQVVYFSEDLECFLQSKEYPRKLTIARENIELMLKSLYDPDTSWHQSQNGYNSCYNIGGLHYNDNYGDVFIPKSYGAFPQFVVGSAPICPECGENKITSSNLLSCNSCSNIVSCYECGYEFDVDYAYTHNDRHYCEECYNQNFVTCNRCYEVIYHEDSCYNNGDSYCEECFDELFEQCDICCEYVHHNEIIEHGRFNYCEYCYDRVISDNEEEELV